jgi:hypothetical protein
MEVAAVASGSDGISLEKAHPLFRRPLRQVRHRAVEDAAGLEIAGPTAKSVRSRLS